MNARNGQKLKLMRVHHETPDNNRIKAHWTVFVDFSCFATEERDRCFFLVFMLNISWKKTQPQTETSVTD